MRITTQYDALTAQMYIDMRERVGFQYYAQEDVQAALQGQLCSVVAYVDNKPVGIGRLVGDGRIAFFIKDLVVLPEYQGIGVGSAVLEALINYVKRHGCQNAYLGLMSTKGHEEFYESHGFTCRPNDELGAGLVRFINTSHDSGICAQHQKHVGMYKTPVLIHPNAVSRTRI